MMLPLLSIGLNHMKQKTYFKTLTRSDKRICLKDSHSERLNDSVDQSHTGANTGPKLVVFWTSKMYVATITNVKTTLIIYVTLCYDQFYIYLKFLPFWKFNSFHSSTNRWKLFFFQTSEIPHTSELFPRPVLQAIRK